MKIFVINLESAERRRRHIVRLLDKYRLDYELVKAVDGRILSKEELEKFCDMAEVRRRPEKLTPGAIGCSLSHLAVYQKMSAENLDAALVLEDDVVVPPNLDEILELVRKQIRPNEVILLHYFQLLHSPVLSRHASTPLSERCDLMYPFEIPRSAAAYVVTPGAARALSEARLPIKVEADDWMHFYETGAVSSIRCAYPPPIRTTFVETQIQPPFQEPKPPVRRRITKFIYDGEIPILYQILMRYRAVRNDLQPFQPVDLVDEPSFLLKETGQTPAHEV